MPDPKGLCKCLLLCMVQGMTMRRKAESRCIFLSVLRVLLGQSGVEGCPLFPTASLPCVGLLTSHCLLQGRGRTLGGFTCYCPASAAGEAPVQSRDEAARCCTEVECEQGSPKPLPPRQCAWNSRNPLEHTCGAYWTARPGGAPGVGDFWDAARATSPFAQTPKGAAECWSSRGPSQPVGQG